MDGRKAEDHTVHGEGQERGRARDKKGEEEEKVSCRSWPPPRRKKPIAIAIAASIRKTEQTLLLQSLRLAQIARLSFIYRVDNLIIYRDADSNENDVSFSKLILEYLATPPYLRRAKFLLRPELKYAGALPPIRGVLHDAPVRVRPGTLIAGLIEDCRKDSCTLYLGKRLGRVKIVGIRGKPGDILPVKVRSVNPLRVSGAPRSFYYWYKVETYPTLRDVILDYKAKGYLAIGTCRLGDCIRDSAERIAKRVTRSKGILLAFGGPYGDVVRDSEGEPFDFIVNTVPLQGVKSVRTEEAVASTLALVDFLVWPTEHL